MQIDIAQTMDLLFQVGVVGAFIFFALRTHDNNAKERTKRDDEWRVFLTEERRHRENGMKSSITSMNAIATEVRTMQQSNIEYRRKINVAVDKLIKGVDAMNVNLKKANGD